MRRSIGVPGWSDRTNVIRKVLFLDFDGVLHPNLAAESGHFCRMPLLEAALRDHPVDVVVSSSWRFHHDWAALLAHFPPTLRAQVRGRTGEAVTGPHARWQEIRAYCEQHAVRQWRALDDSAFEFPRDCAELILCDGAVGLQDPQVRRLRAWLGG